MEIMINQHHCVNCAIKHLASGCVIAKEVLTGYDTPEYRGYLIGNLNEAQEQIAAIDPEISRLIRHFRLQAFPEGLTASSELNSEFIGNIELLMKTIDQRRESGFYQSAERREPHANTPCKCRKKISPRHLLPEDLKRPSVAGADLDLMIPLRAGGSHAENAELRFALRSIETHLKHYRNIYVLSNSVPVGFQNIIHVYTPDHLRRKQMNIHNAIKRAFQMPGISDHVIFWADDNVLLHDLEAAALPTVVRNGSLLEYSNEPTARIWHQSVRNTGEVLKEKGFPTLNYEAHTPVLFQKQQYLALEKEFNFYEKAGLCYISLYLNRYRVEADFNMSELKVTFENSRTPQERELAGKTFVGYNDSGVKAGLLNLLEQRFSTPSRYESQAGAI